ncbi:MAG: hypothetical protein PHW10_04740 [Candidatus Peribacteraceae bacterium]|nr:hypothetical protein [Candidatus Peribacteraceae bacterium]
MAEEIPSSQVFCRLLAQRGMEAATRTGLRIHFFQAKVRDEELGVLFTRENAQLALEEIRRLLWQRGRAVLLSQAAEIEMQFRRQMSDCNIVVRPS